MERQEDLQMVPNPPHPARKAVALREKGPKDQPAAARREGTPS